MRRVVLAIAGTVAGLVVLLTFKSHTVTSALSTAAPAGTAGPGAPPEPPAEPGRQTEQAGAPPRARPAGPVAAGLPRRAVAHRPGRPRVRVTPQARASSPAISRTRSTGRSRSRRRSRPARSSK